MNADDKTSASGSGTIQKLTRLLAAPTIEPNQRAARIQAVEKDIVLPLRAVIIIILAYYFFFAGWLTAGPAKLVNADTSHIHAANKAKINSSNLAQIDDWSLRHAGTIKTSFLIYVILNALAGAVLIWAPHLNLKKIEAMVFSVGLLDALLMGTLTVLNTGFDSNLYWVFPALILHNALAIPAALPQLLLNFWSAPPLWPVDCWTGPSSLPGIWTRGWKIRRNA